MTTVLTGFMGSGKSTVGSILAGMLSLPFVDLDEYIVHKTGHPIPELFENGEEYFRAVEAEAVRDIVCMDKITGSSTVLALGGGTFGIKPIRGLLLEDTVCIYLKTGFKTCMSRIENMDSRPMMSENTEKLYRERLPLYETSHYFVETDGKTPEEVAEEIKNLKFLHL